MKISSIGLVLRGFFMGLADLIPGVSGGTVAFISGIYEELLLTIRHFPSKIPVLFKKGIPAFWKEANLNFALFLGMGLAAALILVTRLITYLLEVYPQFVFAFFFGLILASVWMVGKSIVKWNVTAISGLILGTIVGLAVTLIHPIDFPKSLPFVFLSGAIAICAMILPGISGSFILLLLGMYNYVISSLKDLKIAVIVAFATGCLSGLLAFSHFVTWMFKTAPIFVTAMLTGFMLGSVNKVWPWKECIEYKEAKPGEWACVIERNILPDALDIGFFICFGLAFAGFTLLLIIDYIWLKPGRMQQK